jgi:hypothetical protein
MRKDNKMEAGDLIKWGLIGLAGYFIYETFFAGAGTTYTVATLPTGQPVGTQVTITDGATATDCTVGKGNNTVVCQVTSEVGTVNTWESSLQVQAAAAGLLASSSGSSSGSSGSSSGKSSSSLFSTTAALYGAMLAAAKAANDPAVATINGASSATGYVWDYYLQQVAPNVAGASLSASTGNTTYTSAAYWALVEPSVAAQLGLSGLGRGLSGLAALVMRGRR